MNLTLRVNGRSVDVDVEPTTMLVDVLRDQVGLTGPRVTCGVGLCGTCTVLLDGEPVSGCILMTPLAASPRNVLLTASSDSPTYSPMSDRFIGR